VGLIRGLVWTAMRLAGRRLGPHESPLARGQHIAGILAEGRASGAITHAQSLIAERVVNIGRLRLRDAMVPLEQAVLAPDTATAEEIRELLREHGHPRIGVYAGRRKNIVGEVMTFVVSPDGQFVGVATIKDLVEEIVGELEEW
jgi:CBS domain containing-hemolysin-like protein